MTAPAPSRAPHYAIRAYQPDDAEAAQAMLAEVFGDKAAVAIRETWSWKYVDNPHLPPEGVRMFVTTHDDTLVGMIGALFVRIKVGDVTYPAVWGVDYAVLPRHHGRGIRLLKHWLSHFPDAVQLGNPVGRAYDLEIKLGPRDACRMIRYKCFLRPGNLAASRIRWPWLAAILRALDPIAALPLAVTRRGRSHGDLRLRPAASFDARFDALWDRASRGYAVAVVRDAAALTWRFAARPTRRYHILTAERQGVLEGYLVYRMIDKHRQRSGLIVDCFAAREDTAVLETLVTGAVRALRREGADLVAFSVAEAQDATYEKVLRRNGFGFRAPGAHIIWGPLGLAADVLEQTTDWFFTIADSDMELG